MDQLNRKYKTDIHRKFRYELSELFRTFLRDCLRDRQFTQDETEDVWHLKALFAISDQDHEHLYQAEALDAYKAELKSVLADSEVSVSEKLALERLSAYLQIPEATRTKAFDDIVHPFIQAIRGARDMIKRLRSSVNVPTRNEDLSNSLDLAVGISPDLQLVASRHLTITSRKIPLDPLLKSVTIHPDAMSPPSSVEAAPPGKSSRALTLTLPERRKTATRLEVGEFMFCPLILNHLPGPVANTWATLSSCRFAVVKLN